MAKYDEKLYTELSRHEVKGTDYMVVEYSYNGKPPRIKVVLPWYSKDGETQGEKTIFQGVEKKSWLAIVGIVTPLLKEKAGKVVRR